MVKGEGPIAMPVLRYHDYGFQDSHLAVQSDCKASTGSMRAAETAG